MVEKARRGGRGIIWETVGRGGSHSPDSPPHHTPVGASERGVVSTSLCVHLRRYRTLRSLKVMKR